MVSAPWQGKTTTLHVNHAFLYISLPSLHDYHVKRPNFTFCEGRKHAGNENIFFLFTNLDKADKNSAPEEFACIWQSKRVGIITIETEKMQIHFSCDVFVAVTCRGILNSLIFTKAWSMQAWMPVVSSSLYFWKSVFSFRVDSILKWRVYIKVCVHFFSAWAREAVIESTGRIQRRGRQRERYQQLCIAFFCTFLCPFLHDYDVKTHNFAFYGVRKEATMKFYFSFWTWKCSSGIQFQEGSPTFDKVSGWK